MTPRLVLTVAGIAAACSTRPTDHAVVTEDACGTCHAAELAAWRSSQHRASFTSPDFQRSYRAEPRPDCVACHAPLRNQTAGIGCNACHRVTPARGRAKHAAVVTVACEGCHDFNVPGTGAVLQSTAREHASSAYAKVACAACHMPARDHRFAVSRNPDLLGRALDISAARFERDHIILRVASRGVGHRFPTGDLYRRLTLTVTATNEAGDLVAGETFRFSRDWDRHRAFLHKGQPEPIDDDTRLDDAGRELRIACGAKPVRVHVTVVYERGSGASGDDFDAFSELPIFDHDVTL